MVTCNLLLGFIGECIGINDSDVIKEAIHGSQLEYQLNIHI